MKVNEAGIDLIKSFEGCRLTAYLDQKGILTIGYGCTRDVKPGMTITQSQADERFAEDLARFEEYANNLIHAAVNSNQFSAVVSFMYNLGNGTTVKSGMISALNQGNFDKASSIFPRYAAVNGKHNEGVYKRRVAEQALFNSPVYPEAF